MAALTCSVVIATRDRPDQLRRSMASVLAQSQRPQELIVIDDCSRKDIAAVANSNTVSDVELQFRRLPSPSGAPVARNTGAALAKGDVLMFLDDDDCWERRKIETQLELLRENPRVGFVYTGMQAIDDTKGGAILSVSRNHNSGQGWPNILFRNFVGPTSAVAIRRRLFDLVGGFDPALPALQDYDLWLRLCMRAPLLYDGMHNLRFCAVTKLEDRISSNITNYEVALQHLKRKYKNELEQLSPSQRKQYSAQANLLLTSKHWDQHHHATAAMLLMQAVILYPPTLKRLLLSLAGRLSLIRLRREEHPNRTVR